MKWICLFIAGFCIAFGQSAPPATGSIEGQIVNANTGAPLKKATVRLSALPPLNQPTANNNGGTPPRVLSRDTDEQGRYQFTGLDAGRYMLSASRTGFLQQSYGARKSGSGGVPIVLGDSDKEHGIDLKLTPQAVIIGRVLDEDGDPVPFVPIRLQKLVYTTSGKQWQQRGGGSTNDVGEYRLAQLEPGRYLVGTQERLPPATTEAPDKPELMYAATYYPRSLDESSASPIEVGQGGEIHGIDIRLVKVPGVRVRGKVVNPADSGGRGRAGVQVGLVPREGGAGPQLRGNYRVNDGTFEIRGVQPGSYLLWARSGNGPTEMFASQPLDVGSTVMDGQVLTVAPPIEVPVRVTVAETDAQVDLSTVIVRLRPVMPGLGGAAPMARMENGQFTLRGVTPLKYAVNIGGMPPGCYVQSLHYAGAEVPKTGMDFTSRSPLEVVLSSNAGQISGTITGKDGHPVLRAVVVLMPEDQSLGDLQSGSSDDTGAFNFDRLRPGKYKVLAWEDTEPNAYLDPEFRKLYESQAIEINVGPRDKQTAQIRAIAVEEMK